MARSALSAVQLKRAKFQQDAEWCEASEGTRAMMVPGTVLTLDPVVASGRGLLGNRRNIGFTSSDNEVEVVGLFEDPTSRKYVPTLHFRHLGRSGQMKDAVHRVLWYGPDGPLRFRVLRAAPEKVLKRKGAPDAHEVEPMLVTSQKTAAPSTAPAATVPAAAAAAAAAAVIRCGSSRPKYH